MKSSELFMKIWIGMHPSPEGNNFLFVSFGPKTYGKPLYYEIYNHILKRAVVDAGIKKKVTPISLGIPGQLTWPQN